MEPILKLKHRYVVETKSYIYKGTYTGYTRDDDGCIDYYALGDVTKQYKSKILSIIFKPEKLKNIAVFTPNDIFYDLEEIRENGKKARQRMEKRALNIVLKRLVNETFEW